MVAAKEHECADAAGKHRLCLCAIAAPYLAGGVLGTCGSVVFGDRRWRARRNVRCGLQSVCRMTRDTAMGAFEHVASIDRQFVESLCRFNWITSLARLHVSWSTQQIWKSEDPPGAARRRRTRGVIASTCKAPRSCSLIVHRPGRPRFVRPEQDRWHSSSPCPQVCSITPLGADALEQLESG